jgi:hypothetical protein
MRRLSSIVALLLLLTTAAPVLVCMTGSTMNHEESACRAMHGNCGKMEKMGCCRTEVRTDEHPQIATKTPSIDLHWAVIDWLKPAVVAVQIAPPSLFDVPDEHSPPGLLTATITGLRI